MTRNQALEQIKKELATAAQARQAGNEGMTRVCARRAAGIAIRYSLEHRHRPGWGNDAMTQLRTIERDDTIPANIRDAAKRLSAKVTAQFESPFPTDPLDDSRVIIDHFLQ
jgi:HEPN domain-containing protein